LIASAVLAIAVVGVAGPLVASSEHARVARERAGALAAARQLMEEIASHPLCNGAPTPLGPTLPAESDRSKYDTVGDYHGYRDTTADLKAFDGTTAVASPQPSAGAYARAVTVEYRTPAFDPSATVTDFAVVTVTVTTARRDVVRVSRLFCKQKAVR
jgi:hypothetical protein